MNNLITMRQRLEFRGGQSQQDRMIKDKRESLDHAVLYSYQGAKVKKLNSDNMYRALINSNKLKQDYDDKILSVGFEAEFKPGDVFEWVNTGTYWLIYLQELTELAYFRGDIRKCSYQINWSENGEIKTTFAAIRGPVETKIDYIQKHGISVDTPNYSLHLLLPKTDETIKQFKRYSKFYISDVCWRVEAVDSISTPGILEVSAVEYYANEDEDDVKNGIVGGLIAEPINPNPEEIEELIQGETFIKPKIAYTYAYTGDNFSGWEYDKTLPLKISSNTPEEITLKWLSSYSGQFELKCGGYVKTIVIESLFD